MSIEGDSQMAESHKPDARRKAKHRALILIPITACNLFAIGKSYAQTSEGGEVRATVEIVIGYNGKRECAITKVTT